METSSLKRFATEARKSLLQGVANRLDALGFRQDGTVVERPELMSGGARFMDIIVSEDFYNKWISLEQRIAQHGYRAVAEEAAYTWFNRLMAIRIMAKNDLIQPTLELDEDLRIPMLVAEARQGRMPEMDADTRRKLDALLMDDAKTDEQFALLIVAFCHATPILNHCFGGLQDYTELLLPQNILREHGFLPLLNDTAYITKDDYHSPELIGWLYQFYISDRKDEVFAKNGKYDADEIAAATQIFTPNWIVKYMVQNTVGRIYIDNNPWEEDDLKEKWQYLVEQSSPTTDENKLEFDDLTELKVADLACGSGHILNECFDLLYDLYSDNGYSPADAVRNIFGHNLTGIDLDTRAKQLATFALMLKACQKDNSFMDCAVMPHVLDMPKLPATDQCMAMVKAYGERIGLLFGKADPEELCESFELMQNADSLGTIMKFSLSDATRAYIADAMAAYNDSLSEYAELVSAYRLMRALTTDYSALVMNPPYMGSGKMNNALAKYVKDNYESGKADMCTVFMLLAIDRLAPNGKYGMINMHSWMFLSSFEKLRKQLLDTYHIENLLHLGPRTFDELSGEVVQNAAFVVGKSAPACGTYYRLVDGKNCVDKERMFLAHDGVYSCVSQENFEKIPGGPIGYWLSSRFIKIFETFQSLSDFSSPKVGLQTGDNEQFIRDWFEISHSEILVNCQSEAESLDNDKKWYPYNKGGSGTKWFGFRFLVVKWEHNGQQIKNHSGSVLRNTDCYFKKGLTFPRIGSGKFSVRYSPAGALFDINGPSFFYNESLEYVLAFMNSSVMDCFLKILCPTLTFQVGDVCKVPFIMKKFPIIDNIVGKNIELTKQDWDAHETSWDFQQNEIVYWRKNISDPTATVDGEPVDIPGCTLEDFMNIYKKNWESKFYQLHANEEELNRQFIDIYGLQDELTPDVSLKDITILQQGEISITEGSCLATEDGDLVTDNSGAYLLLPDEDGEYKERIEWHDDVIIKQLLSYAVGCMMGRYSIDKPGLILANQGDGVDEYNALVPDSRFAADDDGIIPMMDSSRTAFTDNAALRLKHWLTVTFGEETLVENLNTIENALGKTVDDYFVKDFWKDHKKMYQNRPIYWLFASKKGAFQCAVYMHRMDAYTAERIRQKYLLPHIEWLVQRQTEMERNAASLTARERKELDTIGKQIAECREYHDRLHTVADQQIAFDLDDGVLVNYAKFGDVLAKLK